MASEGLLQGRITDESLELMRKRIGYANPNVRTGIMNDPHNIYATQEGFRRYAITVGVVLRRRRRRRYAARQARPMSRKIAG